MADFRRRTWVMRNRPAIAPRIIDEEITPSSGWTDNPDFHCLLVDLPGFNKDDVNFNVNESGIIVVSGKKQMGEGKQVHFEKTFDVPGNGDVKSINVTFEGDTLKVVIPKVEKEKKYTPENMNEASSGTIEEKKEVISLPSSNNDIEEKKEKLESPDSSTDTKQESKTPLLDDNTNEKEKEEVKKPDSISDIMEEKKDVCEREEGKEELESHKDDSREKLSEHQMEQIDGDEMKKSSGQREDVQQKTVIVKIIENKGILLASIISFTLGVLFSQKFHTPSPK